MAAFRQLLSVNQSFVLSMVGFGIYYNHLDNQLKIEEGASLPNSLQQAGLQVTVTQDKDDAELEISTLTYGSTSIEWYRSYDLDLTRNPTFISANVDNDELPELIAIQGGTNSSTTVPCRQTEPFVVFDINEADMIISCTLPQHFERYLMDRYHSFLNGRSLTTSFQLALLVALLATLGFWGYQFKTMKQTTPIA
ncbi:MAG: hypothetical protein AAFY26_25340 [Cyanobacteria bacterium J06638_22]